MPIAYSYIRFSSKKQASGDSLNRQTQSAIKYIQNNPQLNLSLDTKLNMHDIGVSAYNSDNITKGNLGKFIEAISEGKIEVGSYLLVENLDRLSRNKISFAHQQFLEILNNGIIIVTLSDNKIFEADKLNLTDLIVSLAIMSRAHEEQEIKGKRVHHAFESKKNKIINGESKIKLGKWTPSWLTLSDDKTSFHVDKERVKIINKIFEWSVEGFGTRKIIQKLEEENIKPFIHKGIKVGRKPKRWHNGIIQRWFTDSRVLGHYTLKTDSGNSLIKDYFPQIVSNELFYRAMDARASRTVNGGGRKGKAYSNLFSKLAMCGYSTNTKFGGHHCAGSDEPMIFISKGKKLKYLQCSRKITGNQGCEMCNKLWRYDKFEISFLSHVKDIDISILTTKPSIYIKKIKKLNIEISSLRGESIFKTKKFNELKTKITNNPDLLNIFEANLVDENIKIDKINQRIKLLEQEVQNKNYEFSKSDKSKELLIHYIEKMSNEDEKTLYATRAKLAEHLKLLIEKVEVYSKGNISNYEILRKAYGDEKINEYLHSIKNKVLPFFIVYYKSGEILTVTPNPNDPKKINLIMKHDNDKIIFIDKKGF